MRERLFTKDRMSSFRLYLTSQHPFAAFTTPLECHCGTRAPSVTSGSPSSAYQSTLSRKARTWRPLRTGRGPRVAFSLPAELRNCIWELAFTSPSSVDFLNTGPPSKSLLLTCRQVHSEAKGLYNAGFRAYWSTTLFTIDVFDELPDATTLDHTDDLRKDLNEAKKAQVYAKIEGVRDEDVAHISHVLIPSIHESDYWRLGEYISRKVWSVHFEIPFDNSVISDTYFILLAPAEKVGALEAENILVNWLST